MKNLLLVASLLVGFDAPVLALKQLNGPSQALEPVEVAELPSNLTFRSISDIPMYASRYLNTATEYYNHGMINESCYNTKMAMQILQRASRLSVEERTARIAGYGESYARAKVLLKKACGLQSYTPPTPQPVKPAKKEASCFVINGQKMCENWR